MKLADLLPETVRTYGKAVTAMVFPALWTYVAVAPNGVTLTEWGMIAVTALAAGGFVAVVPNRLTHEQVERFYQQQEAKYGGIVEAYEDALEGAREEIRHDEPPDGREGKHRRE